MYKLCKQVRTSCYAEAKWVIFYSDQLLWQLQIMTTSA